MKIFKIMPQNWPVFQLVFLYALAVLTSCAATKNGNTPKFAIDPVCGMKAALSEAYSYKYKGVKYFFDSYHCKETFKMHPAKFIKTEN